MFRDLVSECRLIIEAATKADLEKTKRIKALQKASHDAEGADPSTEAGKDAHGRAGQGWNDAAKDWAQEPGHEHFVKFARTRAKHHQIKSFGGESEHPIPPGQISKK